MSEPRRLSDAELLAQLHRRRSDERANSDLWRDDFTRGVRAKIDAGAQPPRRGAPALVGLAGVVAIVIVLAVALPVIQPGPTTTTTPLAPMATPTSVAAPRTADPTDQRPFPSRAPTVVPTEPTATARSLACRLMTDWTPNEPLLPVIVVDETGLVSDCLTFKATDRPSGPSVAMQDIRSSDGSLLVTWIGARCDTGAEFWFRQSDSLYVLVGEREVGNCPESTAYTLLLRLSQAVPETSVDVSVSGMPAVMTTPPPESTGRPPLPSQKPSAKSRTVHCLGAPQPPDNGAVWIEDHTGWVRGCEVERVETTVAPALTSSDDPPSLTMTWQTPCVADGNLTRLELWSRLPTGDAGRTHSPFLLFSHRTSPTDAILCLPLVSGRQVTVDLEQPIDAEHVELVGTEDRWGWDIADFGNHSFELYLESSKLEYDASEAIDVSATLQLVGDRTSMKLGGSGQGGDATNLIGFGFEQLDGDLEMTPAWTANCASYELGLDEPVVAPYSKSGGYWPEGDHEDYFAQYFADPELRLPRGIYRIFAVTSMNIGDCAGPAVDMSASIVIRVR